MATFSDVPFNKSKRYGHPRAATAFPDSSTPPSSLQMSFPNTNNSTKQLGVAPSPVQKDTVTEQVAAPPSPVSSPESSKRSDKPPALKGEFKKIPSLIDPQLEMVTITVKSHGGSSTKFIIHKNFIVYYSPFFKAAFSGNFLEAQTGTMTFHTYSEKAFGLFVNWMYTQRIGIEGEGEECFPLISLWILADQLLIPKLQNDVIDLIDKLNKQPSWLYTKLYNDTTPGSPLRQVFVDHCVKDLKKIEHPLDYPHEMLVDMFNASKQVKDNKKKASSKAAAKRDAEKYHITEV